MPDVHGIAYRSLHGWKYELLEPYTLGLPPAFHQPGRFIETAYLRLDETTLTIKARYAWDGASGPTVDTPDTMRASLVHDALYQLIRLGVLARALKGAADQLLHDLLIADGMNRIRAWYWLRAVRWFGSIDQQKPEA